MIDRLSDEEKALLEMLGLIKPRKKPVVVTEYKIIKGVVKCKLCETVTTQLIKLMKVDNAWVKQEEIPIDDNHLIDDYEEYHTEVRLCWACRDVLMAKEKEELVEIIIGLYNPVLSRQEIWKSIRKAKEDKGKKNE